MTLTNLLKIGPGVPRYLLPEIIPAIDTDVIKIITGQRRTGKSFLLRQLINYLLKKRRVKGQIVLLNFESRQGQRYLDKSKLEKFLEKKITLNRRKKLRTYIFLDEVQEVPGWEKVVNQWHADTNSKVEFFITGSNAKLLSTELGTLLTGRYLNFELLPFSYQEFLNYFDLTASAETINTYFAKGGLPETYQLSTARLKQNYYITLKLSILFKDITKRFKLTNTALLENLLNYLLVNTGNIFSYRSIWLELRKQRAKTDFPTLQQYVSYLATAYLIYPVEIFSFKTKDIFKNRKKIFANELHFANTPPDINQQIENYVFLSLKRAGYYVQVGKVGKYEIDFIAERNGHKIYVQAAYLLSSQEVIDRETRSLLRVRDHYPKYVVSLDPSVRQLPAGLRHVRLWEWEEGLEQL